MNGTTYALELFKLIQNYKQKAEQGDDGLRTAKGFIFAFFLCIPIWYLIIRFFILLF